MNRIIRKKNGGILLIEPLPRGYDDLKDGDGYVHLGKHHRVLLWASPKTDDTRLAKVIWDYNVKNRESVINKFYDDQYTEYLMETYGIRMKRFDITIKEYRTPDDF
jgi:hypothetical protein